MGMRGQRHAPAALSLGKTRYSLYRRLGEPQGRSGRVRKISPQRDSIPGPSGPLRVSIPTELSNRTFRLYTNYQLDGLIIIYS